MVNQITGDTLCAHCGRYISQHINRQPCQLPLQEIGDCTPGDYPLNYTTNPDPRQVGKTPPYYTTTNWTQNLDPNALKTKDTAMKKKAVVFGATGQDGFYLIRLLLEKDYEVIAVRRRSATNNAQRLSIFDSNANYELVVGDVTDYSSILNIIRDHKPDEIYNLAAQSHVGISFEQPQLTWEVTGKGCMNILEAIRFITSDDYKPRFYQASTSEMFGDNYTGGLQSDLKGIVDYNDRTARYQDENTAFNPQSPYAVAKLAAHHQTRLYREAYGMHASSGILFNHESPLRGENFVTRKITQYCAKIKFLQEQDTSRTVDQLALGNLDSRRDWGHAKDYVDAMWRMLQQEKPDDYVIATGHTYSIRQLLDVAFTFIGIEDWKPWVTQDPKFYRPAEVQYLLGKPEKAKRILGWKPEVTFQNLIEEMITYDYDHFKAIGV